jgi:methylisocitrate lyase
VKKTALLRKRLKKGILPLPGAFNAATALLVEDAGFEGVYISGAGLANGMEGVPDIGLLSLSEVAHYAGSIARAVGIPAIADADTGFGEALNVVRTVEAFEGAGVAGLHIEDQESPKRCGHLSGKRLIPPEAMAEKVAAAAGAKRERDFLIIARTDAREVEGLEGAIERGNLYREAGADMIFPEALESRGEFARFAEEVDAPLMANMTEFGRTPYLSVGEFGDLGYSIVLFPLTAFRVTMKAVQEALRHLRERGTQEALLSKMQTREELYRLLRYEEYEALERRIVEEVKRLRGGKG